MKKVVGLCGLLALFAVPAMAQDQPPADQNQPPAAQTAPAKVKRIYVTPKFEISGGYTLRTYYATTGATLDMNGWFGSFDDNLKSWLGVEAEGTGARKNQGGLNTGNAEIYTLLGGPKIFPFRHHKLTPYGHFLFGLGYYENVVPPYGGYPGTTNTYAVYAWQAGGGIDYNLSRHWGIRVVQVDFGSANFYPNTANYTNRGTHRVSFGFVYRFGQR